VAAQVRKLQRAFSKSIREYDYQGAHMCVYPMKVNQQRAVVEEYLREGSRYDFGLEAGSKAELYAALALEQSRDSLLVLNGFKDEEFIELAFAGAKCGKRVVIVGQATPEGRDELSVLGDAELFTLTDRVWQAGDAFARAALLVEEAAIEAGRHALAEG